MAKEKTEKETLEVDGEILPVETVPAEQVTSKEPELRMVRANVHVLGLDVGDVVEIEMTDLIKGLVNIGHLAVVQEA